MPAPRLNIDIIIGPRREKICLRGYAKNKGADQPAHQRNLISAFVMSSVYVNLYLIVAPIFRKKCLKSIPSFDAKHMNKLYVFKT